MSTPHGLSEIAEALSTLDCFAVEGPWARFDKTWALPVAVQLSVPPSDWMPSTSRWFLTVGADLDTGSVNLNFYPAVAGGITATYPHQDLNMPVAARPWRAGKPCLERRTAAFHRGDWSDEPTELIARAQWKAGRLLAWVNAAARDQLLQVGDAMELPVGANQNSRPDIGFMEGVGGAQHWMQQPALWGFAHLKRISDATDTSFVDRFLDPDLGDLLVARASPRLNAERGAPNALWIRLPQLPVQQPWQLPQTWNELRDVLLPAGVDLGAVLRDAGIRMRAWTRRMSDQMLLLGFPLAARVGDPADRMHWLALRLQLCTHKTKRPGFRAREREHRMWDAALAQSSDPVRWLPTQNWSDDQLRTRGCTTVSLRESRILLIGAGALGSALADTLIRTGVRHLGIIDNDILAMGNLSRHALNTDDVGTRKAEALARHCNRANLHTQAVPLPGMFPPESSAVAAQLRGYDMIVDCTASDEVLEAMARFDWGGEKKFLSLSLTWRGEGLLAYYASGTSFPVRDARDRFSVAPRPAPDADEAQIEGIGCWHPVFPATQADVQLWAATGVHFMERTVANRDRVFQYFRRSERGEVVIMPCETDA